MNLEPYQIRVIQEKQELDQKLEKLKSYMESAHFADLPEYDRKLLEFQAMTMTHYSLILETRIVEFGRPRFLS